ncbi:hypothetical protein [Cytobacillus purgationiresistens]|nr:hypothetical protein [Cytobacillus purgationiresistens]
MRQPEKNIYIAGAKKLRESTDFYEQGRSIVAVITLLQKGGVASSRVKLSPKLLGDN